MTPAWILDALGGLMLAVAAVSAARIVLARPWRTAAAVTGADVSHLVMGIAMAGMLRSGLATLPAAAWEVIVALLAAWFGSRAVRDARSGGTRALASGGCLPHLVHSAAMLSMFLTAAAAGGPGMGGPGMGGAAAAPGGQVLRYPALALGFALVLLGYAVRDLDQLSGAAARRAAPAGTGPAARAAWLLSADVTAGCRAVMGTVMAFMLLAMI